jgi:CubicO group peptidase (beta-lactamase class C family)
VRRIGTTLVCIGVFLPGSLLAQNRAAFQAELEHLRRELRIPALSAAVVESGTTVWVRHLGFDSRPGEPVRYPVGGLTQSFAAVLAMQLSSARALALDRSIDGDAPARDVLSHTEGGRFAYSAERLRTLAPLLQQAAGAPFPAALAQRVFKPAGLRHTTAGARTTPAGGIESTVEDLARFAVALERGPLLAHAARLEMFRPARGRTGQPFPAALGWFVQYVGGEELRWQFGRGADASSLLLMLPRRRLALVVLARSDRLTAPFWPEMGDVRWSPAAAAFLTAWARVRIDLAEARRSMMEALAALHASRPAAGRELALKALVLAPALGDSADGALLAAFARSGDPTLRSAGRRVAKRLLAVDPDHPRTLLDLAVLNVEDGQPQDARPLLQRIVSGSRPPPEILRLSQEMLRDVERVP